MKTAFGILRRDVKLLLRNPVALLVVGALLVLPGLYAWYCILANWDPYANTGNVPVAIVNNDKGATSELAGDVNIGQQVVDKLHDNDSLDWHFPESQDEALEDTRAGLYYATIVLPETLSQDMVGLFTGSSAQPTIYYYPNEKFNAVATKVTDSASQTLTRQVNQAFASQVNAALMQAVQTGAHQAEDSASKAHGDALAEVGQVQQDIRRTITALDDASSSIAGWRTAAGSGQNLLDDVAGQLPTIRAGLGKAGDDLDTLRQRTYGFSGSFNDALLQSNELVSGLSARSSSRVASASSDVRQLAGGIEATVVQLRSFRGQIQDILDSLPEGEIRQNLQQVIDEMDSTLASLQQASDAMQAAAQNAGDKAASANDGVQRAIQATSDASRGFSQQVVPQLSAGTDSLAQSVSGLSGAVGQFEPQVSQLKGVLEQTDGALERADASLAQAKTLLEGVGANLQATMTDLGAMGQALEMDNVSKVLAISPDNVGQFLSSPVQMVTEEVYPVSNYGTAVAPFYTNLALWVGCFILVSLIRLEVDCRGFERATPTQRYFGRWLLLALLALMQSQVICGVDILLGIDCANPGWFMLSGAVCSFVYLNIVYALSITFRNIGKTLCILLLIMQVPGSSGMYPIEMMPGFFQAIHPFLPFTYGIDAMREALCGMYDLAYFQDLGLLATLVPASLLLGVAIRPYLLNLTQLFDAELGKAGFFAGEEHGQGRESTRMLKMVRTLASNEMHRDEIEERARRFNQSYPRLRCIGSITACAIPFAFLVAVLPFNLALDLSANVKLAVLAAMIIALLAVSAGLIVLEYAHRTIAEEARLMGGAGGGAGDGAGGGAPLAMGLPGLPGRGEQGDYDGRGRGRHSRGPRSRGPIREIFFTDLHLGFQSVIGVVVMMLLVITPSLYAWFNIAGSWDPYSRTDGLRVAVANDDEGYKGDLVPLTVNVGDAVVAQLRGNSSFDWQFVSHDEAVEGIRAGAYYASIVIPGDFSRSMMTYLVDDAEYPQVVYYTNEKENPIAPLITQKGADSIQENIRETFTERIDEVGLSLGSDMLDYLSKPSVGSFASKMGGHLDDAVGDMQKGATEMRSLADLSGIASGVVDATGSAMDGMQAAAATGKASVDQAEAGISDAGDAFDRAFALVEQAVSQNEGGLDTLADDADAALAGLQDAAADAPDKLRAAQARVHAWKQVLEEARGILEDEAADTDMDADIRADLARTAEGMQPMIDALAKMEEALGRAADGSATAPADIGQARAELKELLTDTKAGVSETRGYFDTDVKGLVNDLKTTMGTVSGSARGIMGELDGTVGGLSDSTDGLSSQLSSLSDGLVDAAATLDSAAVRISNVKMRVNDAVTSGDVQKMKMLLGGDTTELAERLAAPVEEREQALFPVANYGSSMAPFYTVLSLWVGALVMISTMKVHLTEERAQAMRRRFHLKPRHEYLGRLGIFAFVGLLQALLVSLGDLFLLHIQCVHPVLFVLECVYIGQVFCLIVYTFTELFGDVGKAVCIILLIMQVAASGGTFPAEMLAPVLLDIVPFLPFYHGMTALQGCVAGIYHMDTLVYLGFLLVFVLGMFLMGLVARRPFRFVTDWVERQLEKTHYM